MKPIEAPQKLEDAVPTLREIWKYCKTKPYPRNNEVLDMIEDCIKIFEGKFYEVRKKDKFYEANPKGTRNFLKKINKREEKKKK
jgi:hypothetical protein